MRIILNWWETPIVSNPGARVNPEGERLPGADAPAAGPLRSSPVEGILVSGFHRLRPGAELLREVVETWVADRCGCRRIPYDRLRQAVEAAFPSQA